MVLIRPYSLELIKPGCIRFWFLDRMIVLKCLRSTGPWFNLFSFSILGFAEILFGVNNLFCFINIVSLIFK